MLRSIKNFAKYWSLTTILSHNRVRYRKASPPPINKDAIKTEEFNFDDYDHPEGQKPDEMAEEMAKNFNDYFIQYTPQRPFEVYQFQLDQKHSPPKKQKVYVQMLLPESPNNEHMKKYEEVRRLPRELILFYDQIIQDEDSKQQLQKLHQLQKKSKLGKYLDGLTQINIQHACVFLIYGQKAKASILFKKRLQQQTLKVLDQISKHESYSDFCRIKFTLFQVIQIFYALKTELKKSIYEKIFTCCNLHFSYFQFDEFVYTLKTFTHINRDLMSKKLNENRIILKFMNADYVNNILCIQAIKYLFIILNDVDFFTVQLMKSIYKYGQIIVNLETPPDLHHFYMLEYMENQMQLTHSDYNYFKRMQLLSKIDKTKIGYVEVEILLNLFPKYPSLFQYFCDHFHIMSAQMYLQMLKSLKYQIKKFQGYSVLFKADKMFQLYSPISIPASVFKTATTQTFYQILNLRIYLGMEKEDDLPKYAQIILQQSNSIQCLHGLARYFLDQDDGQNIEAWAAISISFLNKTKTKNSSVITLCQKYGILQIFNFISIMNFYQKGSIEFWKFVEKFRFQFIFEEQIIDNLGQQMMKKIVPLFLQSYQGKQIPISIVQKLRELISNCLKYQQWKFKEIYYFLKAISKTSHFNSQQDLSQFQILTQKQIFKQQFKEDDRQFLEKIQRIFQKLKAGSAKLHEVLKKESLKPFLQNPTFYASYQSEKYLNRQLQNQKLQSQDDPDNKQFQQSQPLTQNQQYFQNGQEMLKDEEDKDKGKDELKEQNYQVANEEEQELQEQQEQQEQQEDQLLTLQFNLDDQISKQTQQRQEGQDEIDPDKNENQGKEDGGESKDQQQDKDDDLQEEESSDVEDEEEKEDDKQHKDRWHKDKRRKK